jgi:hypothetical protein
MTGRQRLALLCALGGNAIACQLILGFGDHHPSFTDDAAAAADAGPPLECEQGVHPPGPPDATDNGEKKDYIFAIRTGDFVGAKADDVPGYDLDGVCTCDPRDRSAHGGQLSCLPSKDSLLDASCDDDGGVDNSLTAIFAFAGAGAIDTSSLDQEATCGRSSVLIAVYNYNGQRDDPDIQVGLRASFGIFEGDGGVAVPGCAYDGGGVKQNAIPARWDGNDLWSSKEGDFTDQGLSNQLQNAWVRGGKLVVDTRQTSLRTGLQESIPVVFRDGVMTFGTPILTATIVPVEGKPGQFRLEDGILTGRVAVDEMLDFFGAKPVPIADSPTGDLCGTITYEQLLKPTLCGFAESRMPPGEDFRGAPCNALSVAIRFTAGQAGLGKTKISPEGGTDPCTKRAGGSGGCAP